MATLDLRWEDEREQEIVRQVMVDWALYGEVHITNANGLTRLDPRGITYKPPAPPTIPIVETVHEGES